jgi:hypothetical protein
MKADEEDAHFSQYGEEPPTIYKGTSEEMVLVSFKSKSEAFSAFKKNVENDAYPWLHIIPACKT